MRFSVRTKGHTDIQNITGEIQKIVESSGVKQGLAFIFITATTASLFLNEYEKGLLADLKKWLTELVPEKGNYHHNLLNGDGNAHAHLRSLLFNSHLFVPIENHQLALGRWQSVLLIDFDNRPREREVVIEVIGK